MVESRLPGQETIQVPIEKSVTHANELEGVFPALFTPLLRDDPKCLRNRIDYAKAQSMIDDLVGAGVNGLVPVGTTGQSPTLSPAEHVDFVCFVAEYLDGRLPIIAGAGSNCTRESVEMINALQNKLGKLAVLCVTGYYNNPPQSGLRRHFETVGAETGARIVLYNVPGRTASYLEPETLVDLAHDEHVIGVKQAVDFVSPGKYREDTLALAQKTRDPDFAILSGEDDAFPELLRRGGKGIVTATGNIAEAARLFKKIEAAHRAADHAEVKAAQAALLPFVRAVFLRKNPIPLGTLFDSPLYQPLVALEATPGGAEARAELMRLIETGAPSLAKYHRR
jgi:4-hydroxy-tetrahydrodipicolinate synthase